MDKNNYSILLILLLISTFSATAQEGYHVLYLSNKVGTEYTIEEPQNFLSERALFRRSKQNINLESRDLPVSATYVQQISEAGLEVIHTSKWLNAVLVKTSQLALDSAKKLSFVSSSEYVAPLGSQNNSRTYFSDNNKSTTYSKNYSIQEEANAPQNAMLGITRMHQLGFKGEGMFIAVLDGGFIDLNEISAFKHLYTDGRVIAERNFTAFGKSIYQYSTHGTKAASTIAGLVDGDYTGVAPNASFVFCVTEVSASNSEFKIEEFYWLVGAEFADSIGVDIITTSLGYNTFEDENMNHTYSEMDGKTTIIAKAASRASEVGIVVVASAGNEGNKAWEKITTPADVENILTVGSVDVNRIKSNFSSFGPNADGKIKPDVTCMGTSTTLIDGNGIGSASGTSFSAPQIAGLAAGLWQALPELSNLEIMDLIREAGSQADAPDNELGYGIPTFSRAYGEITGLENLDNLKGIIIYPNPVVNNLINLKMTNGNDLGNFTFQIVDAQGKEIFFTSVNNIGQSTQIQIPNLSKGMYLVKVNSVNAAYSSRLLKK